VSGMEAGQALRRQAEETLRQKQAEQAKDQAPMSAEETKTALHELRVHQIELEMQNEELRRTQVELDAARAEYFNLYDLAPVGYCTISQKGLLLKANLTAAGLLGFARSAMVGQRLSFFIHEDDQDIYYRHYNQLVKTGTTQVFELRMEKSDGAIFWAQLVATAAVDADGLSVCRMTLSDISALREAEALLRASQQDYKNLVNSGMALIWTSGTDKLCNYFNSVWLKFTGRTLEQELGNGWAEGVHPDDFQRCLDIYVGAFDRQEPFSMEYRLRHHDGTYRWLVDEGCPRYDSQGEFLGYIGHCLDIDGRKRLEEEQKKLQAQLHQAQKMEAIGALAGGIAHDFNNILGAILGYAEMVQEDSPAGSSTRKDIDQVVKASLRAKDLVKQILAFSRQAESDRIPLQPAIITKEALKLLRSSLPTTITIQQDIDQDAGPLFADPTQIHQLMMNLCTNAFHAMEKKGGVLTISLQNRVLTVEDLIHEPHVSPGRFVELSIGDSGPGIAPEIQKKIFDPYFTTKEVGKGTGMGLAIVHGIARSYNGFITCLSTPGEGTVFQVLLPIIEDPAALFVETALPDISQLGNEHILLIDDEEILAEMGKTMLERLGYRITVRRNSLEALNTFQSQPDQFDLVITDQTMPGMTGMDMARRMLQIRPGMPIILCTGYSSLISEDKAKSYGIKGFAMKPLSKKDIAKLVREVLHGKKSG
jgi:PAS domain S-box-containing protein